MKTRTLSRGMTRLRKCVALLVTCSLLLMIFAPASQAYLSPKPSDPVPMSFEKDEDPWEEAEVIIKPQFNKCNTLQSETSLEIKAIFIILQFFGIIEINSSHTEHINNKTIEVSSHAKNYNVAIELN